MVLGSRAPVQLLILLILLILRIFLILPILSLFLGFAVGAKPIDPTESALPLGHKTARRGPAA
jgi:hypothetical protein